MCTIKNCCTHNNRNNSAGRRMCLLSILRWCCFRRRAHNALITCTLKQKEHIRRRNERGFNWVFTWFRLWVVTELVMNGDTVIIMVRNYTPLRLRDKWINQPLKAQKQLLKEYFTQKRNIYSPSYCSKSCMTYFILWNTKEDILRNENLRNILTYLNGSLQNIFFFSRRN